MDTARAIGVWWVIALAGCADVLGADFDQVADDTCNQADALRCGGNRLVTICANGRWQRLFECDASQHCAGTSEPSCIPDEISCEYAKGRTTCVGSARVECDDSGKLVSAKDCVGPCVEGECTSVMQVSAGSGHSCALVSNGSVHCWGDNYSGALGVLDGYAASTGPSSGIVELDEPVAEIAAANLFTCARTISGRVWCWGKHIGDPSNSSSHEPWQMPLLSEIVAIRAAGFSACAIDAAGRVYCWGDNKSGQLSSLIEKSLQQPLPMPQLEGAHELYMGEGDTCALFDDGTVACCGGHDHAGFDPDPSTFNPELKPVSGIGPSKSVGVGQGQACVLGEDGLVSCWGQNYFGDLCLGDTVDRWAPTLTLLEDVKAISVGYGTLSLTNSGRIECCGYACGDPLDGTSTVASPVPILLGGVESLSNGASHACAIVRGRVLCWGANNQGQVSPVASADLVRYPIPVPW